MTEEQKKDLAIKIRGLIRQSIFHCLRIPANKAAELKEIDGVLESTSERGAIPLEKIAELSGEA